MTQHPEPMSSSPDGPSYSLSVDQASDLFVAAGAHRSPRTIIRYCARGHLDCIKVDTDQNEKYLITRESVDRRIQEIQQIAASSHVSTQRDESRHDSSRQDTDEQAVENSAEIEQKIEKLEAEILDLTITNRGKDYFVRQLQSERAALMDRVETQSRELGQLETRLKLEPGPARLELPEARSDESDAASSSSLEDLPDHDSIEALPGNAPGADTDEAVPGPAS